jgi:hypothetical protein
VTASVFLRLPLPVLPMVSPLRAALGAAVL